MEIQQGGRRSYFNLLDDSGHIHPAMEYIAGTLDDLPCAQSIPLKQFVKLIGTGEHLTPVGDGRFVCSRSGRTYSRETG